MAGATGDNGLAQLAKTTFAEAMSSAFVASAIAELGSALLAFALLRDKKKPAELPDEALAG